MKLQLAVLFALALSAQLVNAAWHGFEPLRRRLLADSAVRQLAQDVGVARMASGLLDHMDHDPA